METTLYGTAGAPVVAVAGAWEPFTAENTRLLRTLAADARAQGLASLAVVMDPPPTLVQDGEDKWPLFNDAATRLALLRASGVDAVLAIDFTYDDLKGNAEDFFEALCARVEVAEFRLRHRQILGQRGPGSAFAIGVQCAVRKIRLRMLEPEMVRENGIEVRALLASGAPGAAGARVGRPPQRVRAEASARLAWAPGEYRVADGAGRTGVVELLRGAAGMQTFAWPRWADDTLSFVEGPGDTAAREATPHAA